jgi:nucleotide-binding universal stress UspA family protein
VRRALTIASDAEWRIVHARQTPLLVAFVTRQAGNALVAAEINAVRSRLQDEIARSPLRLQPDIQIVEGSADFVIRAQLTDFTPNLLATGTDARGGTPTALLGGFVRDILSDARCDMLVASPDRA